MEIKIVIDPSEEKEEDRHEEFDPAERMADQLLSEQYAMHERNRKGVRMRKEGEKK